MTLSEIIHRRPMIYKEKEMIYVVEQYIKNRTGKNVKINLYQGGLINHQTQLHKLMIAFNTAHAWFLNPQLHKA